jgi:dimeric dUTPase (all-alpha-NTP-PPase superfamily)
MESKYDEQFRVVFDAIRELMTPPEKPARRIGFGAPMGGGEEG